MDSVGALVEHGTMRRVVAVISVALSGSMLAGCSESAPAVEQFGAMREVMREGRTEPRVVLADVVAEPHAYGVGALEGLSGEVTILDGAVWVSRVAEGGVRVAGPDPDAMDRATLLTLAHVPRWRGVPIESVVAGAELEALIEREARARGVDASEPFPFVIEGAMAGLELHVINGYCPVAVDPSTIDAEPWRWSSERVGRATLVGFFAPDAAGVMTHHGTSVHVHAVVSEGGRTIAGHVDRVSVSPRATLRLPAPSR